MRTCIHTYINTHVHVYTHTHTHTHTNTQRHIHNLVTKISDVHVVTMARLVTNTTIGFFVSRLPWLPTLKLSLCYCVDGKTPEVFRSVDISHIFISLQETMFKSFAFLPAVATERTKI